MRLRVPRIRHRRRWIIGGAALLAALAVAAGFALHRPSPVGYFVSAQAQDRFLLAYRRAMAELPEPDRSLDIRTSYGVVRVYHFAGASPGSAPLLLLPGRAAPSPVWADNLPSLLRLRDVYTVDLLGEPGMSVQQRPIESAQDQARWLHEVVRALPVERLHLVGLSIGGWTAMNLAARRPEKIASVILLEPVLVFTDLAWQAVVRSIPASLPWLPRSWRDDFASWTANDAPVEDVPVADMIEAGMQAYVLKLPTPDRLGDEQLAGVRMPVLTLLAGKSRMHDSVAGADRARRVLPDGTVKVYPDASHAINGEHPEEIAADIATHLATVT
ncbi:Pimeloyl-ACP methyl ester carboxylesterase [Micromonospora nigra]|uniref:Pimeloyl-ACP methyl ester carboxylesterase n=1 Tax=Micromonospora nigra TaxID=145857 RepID=A0A1C6T1N3_9ACTN|nr:alpha/beta hydrolase [Micromonospora nigra]SCL35720.1 Pimeloyl-ACP methyl ester carboxylesterase [Micromonospora nigra]